MPILPYLSGSSLKQQKIQNPDPDSLSLTEPELLEYEHPDPPLAQQQQEAESNATNTKLLTTLIGALARIEENQKELLEQMRISNDQQKELLRQQKMHTASVLRSEHRAVSNSVWRPLPMLNGDPLPKDILFPSHQVPLDRLTEDECDRLLEAYDLTSFGGEGVYQKRMRLKLFLLGYA